MKKHKYLIGIIIMIIGLFLISFGVIYSLNNKNEPKYYDSLFDLADDMYEDESYLKLPRNDKGLYYMTIGEFKKRNYNTNIIDLTCDDNFGIIYFDVENKENYNDNPIYVVNHCKPENDSNTSLIEIANDIYEKNEYTNLPMDDYGGYYMTIGEYKLRGYNLDLIDATCSNDSQLIYFDIANKDKYDEGATPVFVFDNCK